MESDPPQGGATHHSMNQGKSLTPVPYSIFLVPKKGLSFSNKGWSWGWYFGFVWEGEKHRTSVIEFTKEKKKKCTPLYYANRNRNNNSLSARWLPVVRPWKWKRTKTVPKRTNRTNTECINRTCYQATSTKPVPCTSYVHVRPSTDSDPITTKNELLYSSSRCPSTKKRTIKFIVDTK